MAFGMFLAVCGLFVADGIWFASDHRQREILADYVPGARCDKADFEVIERQDLLSDWLYVVRIGGSVECIASIKNELTSMGAISRSDGVFLPGHIDPDKEAVSFKFESGTTVIWTRDKR